LLQIIALSVFFKSQTFQQVSFMNSTSGISNTFVEMDHSYKKYFGLSEENKRLQTNYKSLLENSPISLQKLTTNQVAIDDTLYRQEYTYIAGEVLRSTTHKANNYITANVGKKQGVKKGMGVINHDGLVGVVYEVSQHYCLIKSLLSKEINIDVSLSSGEFGFLKWDGKNPKLIQVSGFPNDIEIKNGDTFLTRGTGGVFPRGIMVGKVHEFKFAEGESNWSISLNSSVDFRGIKSIYIVNHLNKQELENLENLVN